MVLLRKMTNISWNTAIEAAAVVADEHARRAWTARHPSHEAAFAAEHIADEIRKLKVDDGDQQLNQAIVGAAGDEALCAPTDG